MLTPGDVVTANFPGVQATKRRPCVVVSTTQYHQTRPDVILGLLTSRTASATQFSDCLLQDRASAGLYKPSAFRSFLFTLAASSVTAVGRLSDRDWQAVQQCLRQAIATR